MFGSKLIIYLKRNSLEVYQAGTESYLARLEFPPDIAKDEEIVDQPKFEELIFTFLNKLSLKENSAQLVLSEEVIFAKTIPLSIEETEEKQAQQFFQEVPFDTAKIAKCAVKTKNGINLFAVNKNLFIFVCNVLSKMQIEVVSVIPATMFGITQSLSALTRDDLKKINSNSDLVKMSNFLEGLQESKKGPEPKSAKQPADQDTTSSSSNLIAIAGVALIILGITVAIYLYKKPNLKDINLSLPFIKKQAQTTTSSPSPTIDIVSASPQTQVTKDDLTVKVLNGTGKGGQASLVKNALENIGFSNIQTDNAQTQNFETCEVNFSSKVPIEVRQEIVDNLEKTFSQVKMNVEVSQDFDIIVTTGTQI